MKKVLYNSRGFGAIELLIVFAVLSSMYTITLLGINPAKQLATVNNAKRVMDIRALNDALMFYAVDHDGNYPPGITSQAADISKTNGIDLCNYLVPQYLPGLPTDPVIGYKKITDCSLQYDSRYTILKNAFDDRITVSAPNAELGESIELTQ